MLEFPQPRDKLVVLQKVVSVALHIQKQGFLSYIPWGHDSYTTRVIYCVRYSKDDSHDICHIFRGGMIRI